MTMLNTAVEGAALIAQRCDKAHQTQDGWQACCPAHEDRTPSLSITPTDDRILPNRATTSCTLAGHSADFIPSVPTRRAGVAAQRMRAAPDASTAGGDRAPRTPVG